MSDQGFTPPPNFNPNAGFVPPPPVFTPGTPIPPPPSFGSPVPPPPAPAAPSAEEETYTPIGSFGREGNFHTNIRLPEHSTNFDENLFLGLLAGSISLSRDEKKKILSSLPNLSQFQIDELIKIFQEEKAKFSELDVKHREQLRTLEAKHAAEWESIEMEYEQMDLQSDEESAAEDIRKSLGIND